jgi:uridine kinase
MTGYQIVSESIQQDTCVLLTGTGGAGKSTISHKLAKKLKLTKVISIDQVMSELVKKKYPGMRSWRQEDLAEHFGSIEKAKKIMWAHQLPAFKQSLAKYRKDKAILEGMAIYQPNAYNLIDSFNGKILVIRPTTPQDHLRKRIKYAKMDNYLLSPERQKGIIDYYKKEVVDLKKFINRFKDKITLVDN